MKQSLAEKSTLAFADHLVKSLALWTFLPFVPETIVFHSGQIQLLLRAFS